MIRAGLVGSKLSHSYSPRIHQIIWNQLGLTGEYDLIELAPYEVQSEITKLDNKYIGVNVTVPYKETVARCDVILTDVVERIGAANTLFFNNEKIYGYNTDYFGFGVMLDYYGIKIPGRKCVILGSGGAAKMVCCYLTDHQTANVVVVTRQKFKEVQQQFVQFKGKIQFCDYTMLEAGIENNLLINATPVGMYPANSDCPVCSDVALRFATVVDLVYNPMPTVLVRQSLDNYHQAVNGLYMLVAQAVASEEIWLQRKLPAGMILQIYGQIIKEIQ